MRKILIAAAVAAPFFVAVPWMLGVFGSAASDRGPPQVATPPLSPITRTSLVLANVTVSDTTIRDALEAAAPRDVNGKRDKPLGDLVPKSELAWTVTRGPIAVAARADAIAVSTGLSGTLRLSGQAGNIGNRIAGIAGADIAQAVQRFAGKGLDQKAQLRGGVTLTARPVLTTAWRLDPNLNAQVQVGDVSLPAAGVAISVGKDVKPLIDRAVADQVGALGTRIRNDPMIEKAVRREWEKICRSIPLKSAAPGMENLWLEVRPVRAMAAQPRIELGVVRIVLGLAAETRVTSGQTQPQCAFPAALEIMPPAEGGRIAIGLPIDIPFTEVSRLLESKLRGRSFPNDGSPIAVTIETATLAGAGDRLLLSLKVMAAQSQGWFGAAAPANVYIWGRAVLNADEQTLRFADVALDIESEAAFGLFGAAARAAIPYLRAEIEQRAVIDLKPFAESALHDIEAAVRAFSRDQDGIRVDAAIQDIRLGEVAFDATTLRLVAEVQGAANVVVSKLPR